MKNVSAVHHANFNGASPIGAAETLASIRFWDVGTGNCNSLVNNAGQHYFYYDFGGNFKSGGGAKSYPNPIPAFDFTANPTVLVSHWDGDHYYSLKKNHAAGAQAWIGTREDISGEGQKLLNAHCTNLRAIPKAPTGLASYKFRTTGGVILKLVRCVPDPGGTQSEGVIRNNSGIALMIYLRTAAGISVRAVVDAAAGGATINNTAAAAGALSNDIYKNLIVRAVTVAQGTAANPNDVVTAARGAIDAAPVKVMARAVIAAIEHAQANAADAAGTSLAAATAAGLMGGDTYVAQVLLAAQNQSVLVANNAALVATAAKNALTLGGTVVNAAAVAAVAMVEHALANPVDNAGTITAGGAHNNDPYIKQILEAAKKKAAEVVVPTARQVAQAAVDALSPAPKHRARVLLTGDAGFQAIPDSLTQPWDLLLAFHHGTKDEFTTLPPDPVLRDVSRIVYSSGKRGATKIYGHPHQNAINDYRGEGWTQEYYTTHGYGNLNHGGGRGIRDINIP